MALEGPNRLEAQRFIAGFNPMSCGIDGGDHPGQSPALGDLNPPGNQAGCDAMPFRDLDHTQSSEKHLVWAEVEHNRPDRTVQIEGAERLIGILTENPIERSIQISLIGMAIDGAQNAVQRPDIVRTDFFNTDK